MSFSIKVHPGLMPRTLDAFVHYVYGLALGKSNRKAMNRNWSTQKANPALKTKAGNK